MTLIKIKRRRKNDSHYLAYWSTSLVCLKYQACYILYADIYVYMHMWEYIYPTSKNRFLPWLFEDRDAGKGAHSPLMLFNATRSLATSSKGVTLKRCIFTRKLKEELWFFNSAHLWIYLNWILWHLCSYNLTLNRIVPMNGLWSSDFSSNKKHLRK